MEKAGEQTWLTERNTPDQTPSRMACLVLVDISSGPRDFFAHSGLSGSVAEVLPERRGSVSDTESDIDLLGSLKKGESLQRCDRSPRMSWRWQRPRKGRKLPIRRKVGHVSLLITESDAVTCRGVQATMTSQARFE